jgi:hypothetical protein
LEDITENDDSDEDTEENEERDCSSQRESCPVPVKQGLKQEVRDAHSKQKDNKQNHS